MQVLKKGTKGMKEFTRFLKEQQDKDFEAYRMHNNTKYAKRTSEQNEQALNDKRNYYKNKWENLKAQSETVAQKRICENMISNLYLIRV